MEGGRENNINNVLRFLLISSSSERSSVMYVQDTQEGVLADSMSHQSNKSITKVLEHGCVQARIQLLAKGVVVI